MPIIAIDFETANSQRASPCAVGIARLGPAGISAELRLIRPPVMAFDNFNMMLHGITPEMVENAPEFPEVWADLCDECEASAFVLAHNAGFDIGVVCDTLALYGLPLPRLSYLCTCIVARNVWPGLSSYSLDNVARHLALALDHHQARSDALAALGIATAAATARGVSALEDLPQALGLKLLPRLADGQISGYRSPRASRNQNLQLNSPPKNLDPEHPLFGCG